VNVSARQLKAADFAEIVERALEHAGLPPHLLELEVTESMLMDEADASLTRLRALKQIGVRIAIDDFGTGYSNLGHLRRFRANRIKVDKSFVWGVIKDSDARAIVSTIIALGHTMGLSTIAEGVETQEQAGTLRELGCKEFQGYFFGKPMPAPEFERSQGNLHRPE
jgi:EAL domain-containing protein (putative c-di-GMP-specific phosphodiesterase class I)